MISVYDKQPISSLNMRKKENIDKYLPLIQWGRANPTRFIEKVLGIQLIDFQKNIILGTWTTNQSCWLASRNSGKSFLIAIYAMTRAILLPHHAIYILSNSGKQSQETFEKIEKITKGTVASLASSGKSMFYGEMVRTSGNMDGFNHDPGFFSLKLYNDSTISTLPANPDTIRGRRANCVIFDEAAFVPEDIYEAAQPFINQNADFKTGANFDYRVYPKTFQNQIILASSAGSVNSQFYKAYKECMINNIIGNPGYFVVDINCDMTLKTFINGEEKPPIANPKEVEMTKQTNEAKYLREYMNVFDDADSPNSLLQRAVILRNEKPYLPESMSTDPSKSYVLCYDPAVEMDNSFVLIAEVYKDPQKGWRGKIVNGVNLIEKMGINKKPLRIPEQVEWVNRLLVAYNNRMNNDYTNVILRIDAGTGGGGKEIPDFLMLPFRDDDGFEHFGIYDSKIENEAYQNTRMVKHPEAVDILHSLEPRKLRTTMFDDLVSVVTRDMLDFPISCPPNGELQLEDGSVKVLTFEEKRALLEIDVMKEEVLKMQKINTAAGDIKYSMPKARDHDDRVYTLAMLCNYIADLDRADRRAKGGLQQDFGTYLQAMSKKRNDQAGFSSKNPFQGKSNPFKRQ